MSRPATILLGLALGVSLVLPVGVRPVAATSPSNGSWEPAACPADGTRPVDLPDDHASLATSIATLRGRGAWIVGMHAGQGISRRAWIMRRTATGWREVQAAPTGPDGGLMAVDALRSDAAWAVGFHTTSRFLRPVSQRWDGRSWRAVGVPSASRSEALVDVAMADASTAWAVGFRTTGRGPAPTALRTRGGRWERHDPDLPTGTFGSLVAIDIAPDGTPWAAGWQSDGTAPRPLVLRFTGGRWTRVTTPSASVETVLTDLVADGGRVSVLGYTQTGTEQRALLWERDATGWTADPALPRIAGAMLPTGLAADADGRPLIAGAWRGAAGGGHAAMVGARIDGAWRISRAPEGLGGPSQLRSVAWADHAALGVGWTGGQGVASSLCDPWAVDEAISAAPSRGLAEHDGPTGTVGRRGARGSRDDAGAGSVPLDSTAANGIRFVDLAATAGLPGATQSYGATVLDLDGDGWDDVLLSRHTDRGRVLRNRHGRFVAAAADPLPPSTATAAQPRTSTETVTWTPTARSARHGVRSSSAMSCGWACGPRTRARCPRRWAWTIRSAAAAGPPSWTSTATAISIWWSPATPCAWTDCRR